MRSFTLVLSVAASVVAVAACSQSNYRTPITPRTPTPFQAEMTACSETVRSSERVSKDTQKTAQVCGFVAKDDLTVAPTASSDTVSVAYGLSKGEGESRKGGGRDKILISMNIGLRTPDNFTDAEKTDFIKRLSFECSLEPIIRNSSFRAGVMIEFDPQYEFVGDDGPAASALGTTTTYDQYLVVRKVIDGNDTYVEAPELLTQPKFSMRGRSNENAACKNTNQFQQQSCAYNAYHKFNRAFCAAYVRRVSAWLGLVNADAEKSACTTPTKASPESQSPTPVGPPVTPAPAKPVTPPAQGGTTPPVKPDSAAAVVPGAAAVAPVASDAAGAANTAGAAGGFALALDAAGAPPYAPVTPPPQPATVPPTLVDGKPVPTATPVQLPAPTSSFVRSEKLTDDDYLSKSALDRRDLVSILAPYCPSLVPFATTTK